LECQLQKSRCGEVLRGAICPRCQKTFYICRHCDQGHVYCSRQCFLMSRAAKCRGYRRRYRQSPEGRADHRDRERSRRRARILGKEIVVDQGYEEGVRSARVSARVRLAAALAVLSRASEENKNGTEVCCSFCGRRGEFVFFGEGTRRNRDRGRIFRLSS